ncbi:hypothetical protein BDV25DRAFT_63553 [Aspergillus avenaceus]|uniref:Uncharacterized protein n=1 Tax=Aspergillus avenaceus TaxID=36643 RepID=A0A5N6TH32_ASPAV|nr:hypothetical protein BDV25DRAFT_63553 [Aspergillus avenaceus]
MIIPPRTTGTVEENGESEHAHAWKIVSAEVFCFVPLFPLLFFRVASIFLRIPTILIELLVNFIPILLISIPLLWLLLFWIPSFFLSFFLSFFFFPSSLQPGCY